MSRRSSISRTSNMGWISPRNQALLQPGDYFKMKMLTFRIGLPIINTCQLHFSYHFIFTLGIHISVWKYSLYIETGPRYRYQDLYRENLSCFDNAYSISFLAQCSSIYGEKGESRNYFAWRWKVQNIIWWTKPFSQLQHYLITKCKTVVTPVC